MIRRYPLKPRFRTAKRVSDDYASGNCKPTVEHLTQDRVGRSTEVHVERIVRLAEVMKLEDELLGEELLASPDDPSHADSAHSVFVSRGIDTGPTLVLF
jgi:hypothetical protein